MRTHFTKNFQKKTVQSLTPKLTKVFKQSEAQLQESVMRYLAYFYPNVLAIHVPNEGKRSKFTVKKMGIKAGVPDVLIFERDAKLHFIGLALELKIKPNKPTQKQFEFMEKLESRDWNTFVCFTFDEAKERIDDYFKNKSNGKTQKEF